MAGVTDRVPDLLVVGAMKCGTTTLHADLSQHPHVEVAEKELGGLHRYDVTTVAGRQLYLAQWQRRDSFRVDVAATYAMFPDVPDVPERAASVAPDARILYLVREPVSRILSHHHHDLSGGTTWRSVDEAVRQDPRFLAYSRYWTQLEQWRAFYPDAQIKVVRFEDYVAGRRRTVMSVLDWLGLPPMPGGDFESVHNVGTEGRVARGGVRRFTHSTMYRTLLRPLVPNLLRSGLRTALTTQKAERPEPPATSTVVDLVEALRGEVTSLADYTGGAVTWDMDEVLARYEAPTT